MAQKHLLTLPDSVLHYVQLALKTSKISGYHGQDRKSFYMQGHAYRMKGELKTALESLLQASSLSSAEADSLDSEIFFQLGGVYTELGQYDAALKNYHDAVRISEKNGNEIGIGKSLNSISLIYYRINDLKRADEYNKQALKIWEYNNYARGLASSYTIEAYILTANEEFDTAISYHEKAQELYLDHGYMHMYANSFLNIGDVYLKKGEPEKAESTVLKSLELSRNKTYLQIYVDGLNKLGQSLTSQGKYTIAEDTLFSGLEKAREINDQSLLAEFYEHIAEMYYVSNNLRKAYEYKQLYEFHKDNIFRNERAIRIAEFQVLYQTEQIRKEKEALEIQSQRRLWITYTSIVALVFIIVVILMAYSRYRIRAKFLRKQKEEENARLQMEVMHRHNELSSITMHLFQKNESLNRLLEEVESMEKNGDQSSRMELKNLKTSIQQNLQLDDDWERFKMHFNQVHQGFIDRLSHQYDNLSNLDLRHCSYIRMNLSTKEISRLMNISPTSVQKSRVRLKKKLGLTQNDDLFDFLIKY
jgi:tetratricopeptide (TPR) repeat protein